MEAKRFELSDYDEIKAWYEARHLAVPKPDTFPGYGLIVKNVAAGFVILTDAKLGILEFYISNPWSSEKRRDDALDEITKGLMQYGRQFGCKHFMCTTQLPAIGQRAMKHGLEFQGQFYLYFLKGE